MDPNGATFRVNLFHKLVNSGLFICGLPMEMGKKRKWSYYIFTFFISFFLILGSLTTLLNTSEKIYKLQATIRLFLSTIIALIFLYFCINRNNVKDLFAKFHQDSPAYIGDEEMRVTAREFLKNTKYDLMLFGGVMVAGQIAGILAKFFGQDLYDYFYLYSCGSSDEQPAIEFCFSKTNLNFFIINQVMVFVFVIYQGFIAQVAQLLILSTLECLKAKLKRYNDLLSKCIEKVENMDKFDTNDRLEFKTVIKYQQNIIRHNQSVRSMSHIPITLHLVSFYIMSIFVIVSVGSKKFQSVFLTVPFIIMACYVSYLHYTLCINWQAINSSHEHFCETLLQFPWYERNLEFQKFYLISLQLNQKCYPITLFGLYEVNLHFFTDNMKRVYSVVNLLLLKYKS